MLQAPSDHELRWSARVFIRQRRDGWVLHPESTRQRSICFDDDVMLLAEGGDFSPGVERMYFDLVDGRVHARLRSEQLLQLKPMHKRMTAVTDQGRRTIDVTYVLDAKVANTSALHLSIVNSVFDSLPTFQSLGLSAIRTVQ